MQGAGARNVWPRARAVDLQNKISTLVSNLNFFPPAFIREGRGCGEIFFPIDGGGAGARRRGGGGGSVCPFVCVSRKVIRPHWLD